MTKTNTGVGQAVKPLEAVFAEELSFLETQIAQGVDEGDGFLQALVDHVKVKGKKFSFKQLAIIRKKMTESGDDDSAIRKKQQKKLEAIMKSPKLDEQGLEFMQSLYGQTATKKLSSKQEYYLNEYYTIYGA